MRKRCCSIEKKADRRGEGRGGGGGGDQCCEKEGRKDKWEGGRRPKRVAEAKIVQHNTTQHNTAYVVRPSTHDDVIRKKRHKTEVPHWSRISQRVSVAIQPGEKRPNVQWNGTNETTS